MTEQQAAEWRQDAEETLGNLDLNKHNKDAFLTLGASLAILGRDIFLDGKTPAALTEAITAVQPPHDALYFAHDELNAADEYHRLGLDDIARDELRHAAYWIEQMRSEARTAEQRAIVRDLQVRHDLIEQTTNEPRP